MRSKDMHMIKYTDTIFVKADKCTEQLGAENYLPPRYLQGENE